MDKVTISLNIQERNGRIEGEPGFHKKEVYIHPIPKKLQKKLVAGEEWRGHLGKATPAGTDKKGRAIYIQPFIPTSRVTTAEITLPDHAAGSVKEWLGLKAAVVMKSGSRAIKSFYAKPKEVGFLNVHGAVVGRLVYKINETVSTGCARFLKKDEARALGCPEGLALRKAA